jgi:hypothetical protein
VSTRHDLPAVPVRAGQHRHRSGFSRAADAAEAWLLAFDPDRHSPRLRLRAVHWFRTCCRFGLLYAAGFTVFYMLAWWVLPALGIR